MKSMLAIFVVLLSNIHTDTVVRPETAATNENLVPARKRLPRAVVGRRVIVPVFVVLEVADGLVHRLDVFRQRQQLRIAVDAVILNDAALGDGTVEERAHFALEVGGLLAPAALISDLKDFVGDLQVGVAVDLKHFRYLHSFFNGKAGVADFAEAIQDAFKLKDFVGFGVAVLHDGLRHVAENRRGDVPQLTFSVIRHFQQLVVGFAVTPRKPPVLDAQPPQIVHVHPARFFDLHVLVLLLSSNNCSVCC
ncbi:hypothetical protein 2203_scaffold802_00091 [Bacteriophage sp.]|nr:hypothetical protein 2203_scaffold802_00091 [Bacteriophage sp.]